MANQLLHRTHIEGKNYAQLKPWNSACSFWPSLVLTGVSVGSSLVNSASKSVPEGSGSARSPILRVEYERG